MNQIEIHFCTQCKWLLRSTWMAQELLSTFETEINKLSLKPGTGGVFEIHVNKVLIWERKRDKGFPDIKTLKQLVRNVIAPEKNLGHIDRKNDH